jgi:hypothetical protein
MKAELLFQQRVEYDDGAIVRWYCGGFRCQFRLQSTD